MQFILLLLPVFPFSVYRFFVHYQHHRNSIGKGDLATFTALQAAPQSLIATSPNKADIRA